MSPFETGGEPPASKRPDVPVVQQRTFWLGAAAGAGLLVALVVSVITAGLFLRMAINSRLLPGRSTPATLRSAAMACDPSGSGTSIADKGKTLVIDGKGEEDLRGVDLATLDCLLGRLEVPVAIKQKMFETRALDGRQDGSWGRLQASWSYHPDQGLDLIVTSE